MSANATNRSAVVYVGNQLAKDEFLDDAKRSERLDNGLRAISGFPDIQVLRSLPSACAVLVLGPVSALRDLAEHLRDEGIGQVTIDDEKKPMFRAAT